MFWFFRKILAETYEDEEKNITHSRSFNMNPIVFSNYFKRHATITTDILKVQGSKVREGLGIYSYVAMKTPSRGTDGCHPLSLHSSFPLLFPDSTNPAHIWSNQSASTH